jgi:hypothetical protein
VPANLAATVLASAAAYWFGEASSCGAAQWQPVALLNKDFLIQTDWLARYKNSGYNLVNFMTYGG